MEQNQNFKLITKQSRFSSSSAYQEESDQDSILWFHASSQGESESLWPILKRLDEISSHSSHKIKIIFTVFSPSAYLKTQKLKEEFKSLSILFSGLSPFEGDWEKWFEYYKPTLFISYKYEIWPDLLRALREKKIPLWLTAVQPKSRFYKLIKWSEVFHWKLPEVTLFSMQKKSEIRKNLNENHDFNTKRFHLLTLKSNTIREYYRSILDFRWDRQLDLSLEASLKNNLSFQENIKENLSSEDFPIVTLGSIYMEDLKYIFTKKNVSMLKQFFKGKIYVFPQKLDSNYLNKIKVFIQELNLNFIVLIEKPGVLAHFYRFSDIAYVGGGFNKGIHSTIQPSFYGCLCYCGPKNVEKFYETIFLREINQLMVLKNKKDFSRFIQEWTSFNQNELYEKKKIFLNENQKNCGGSQEFIECLKQEGFLK